MSDVHLHIIKRFIFVERSLLSHFYSLLSCLAETCKMKFPQLVSRYSCGHIERTNGALTKPKRRR